MLAVCKKLCHTCTVKERTTCQTRNAASASAQSPYIRLPQCGAAVMLTNQPYAQYVAKSSTLTLYGTATSVANPTESNGKARSTPVTIKENADTPRVQKRKDNMRLPCYYWDHIWNTQIQKSSAGTLYLACKNCEVIMALSELPAPTN